MLKFIQNLRETLWASNRSRYLGDISTLKIILAKPQENSELAQKVVPLLKNNNQEIRLEDLSKYKEGSLGHAYYNFLVRHKLSPINFSGKYSSYYEKYPLDIRYTRIHDLYHVLLDFDTSIAGELGVYAFVKAKNYSTALNEAYKFGKLLARFYYWQKPQIVTEYNQKGFNLAKKSEELITINWEERFSDNLESIRKEFRLVDEFN